MNFQVDLSTFHNRPPPSAIDAFARGDLPSLADRRSSIRASRSAAQLISRSNTRRSLPGISDFGPFHAGSPFDNKLTMAQLEERIQRPPGVLPEAYEDYFDAMAPINDQLEQAKGWWILELTPCKRRVQQSDGSWKKGELDWRRAPRVMQHSHLCSSSRHTQHGTSSHHAR